MKEFKSIISNQEGQNLFPGLPTFIKGDKQGTQITMKNTDPQVALTPYGASYMMPDQDYNFAGNSVLELPMNKAQAGGPQGGGQEQLQQILMAYAQMKGMQPEELMQKLQSLPEEQQQQAIQAIAQEVQQAMAQQQQQPQMGQPDQEGMMEQEQEMGMAMHGGKACIDCEEQFPQAQNLNWFYKAAGGEAFPQANRYPEDWANYSGNQYAQGGEAFPQAQTYLPYDRGSKPAPNFMFQQGGTLYDYVKSMGLDPSFKSRKKLFSKYFKEPYVGSEDQNIYLLKVLKSNKRANAVAAASTMSMINPQLASEVTPSTRDSTSPYAKNIDNQYNAVMAPLVFRGYGEGNFGGAGAEGSLQSGGATLKKEDYEKTKKEYFDALSNYGQNKLSTEQYNQMQFDHADMIDNMRFYEPQGYYTPLPFKDAAYQIGNTGRNIFNQIAGTNYKEGGEPDQYGGSTDIDQIYQIMKAGGFDMDPKKKKGGKFDANSFEDYVMKNGGLQKAYVGINMPKTPNPISQFKPQAGPWNSYNTGTMTNDINSVRNEPMSLRTNQSYMQDTSKIPDTGVTGSTPKTATRGQYNPYSIYGMDPYSAIQYMGTQGKPGGLAHGLAAVTGLGNALATSASGWKSASKKQTWKDTFPFLNSNKPDDSDDSDDSDDYEYLKAAYGGMLPRAQFGPPQEIKVGQNLSQPQGAFNMWGTSAVPADVQSSPAYQQVQQANQAAPQVASWNQQTQGTDTEGGKPTDGKANITRTSGIPQAMGAIAGLSTAANFMEAVQQNKADKDLRSKMNTSEFMGMAQMGGPLDYGDYLMNATQGPSFRPNSYVYAQKESSPYMDQPVYYAQGGSILDNYDDGEEYDLTQEEIDAILAAGGSIDYI